MFSFTVIFAMSVLLLLSFSDLVHLGVLPGAPIFFNLWQVKLEHFRPTLGSLLLLGECCEVREDIKKVAVNGKEMLLKLWC